MSAPEPDTTGDDPALGIAVSEIHVANARVMATLATVICHLATVIDAAAQTADSLRGLAEHLRVELEPVGDAGQHDDQCWHRHDDCALQRAYWMVKADPSSPLQRAVLTSIEWTVRDHGEGVCVERTGRCAGVMIARRVLTETTGPGRVVAGKDASPMAPEGAARPEGEQ